MPRGLERSAWEERTHPEWETPDKNGGPNKPSGRKI